MSKESKMPGGLSKPLIAAIILLIATTTLLSFQNCTQYPAAENVSSLADKLPFPYETSLDNISYMSCEGLTSSTTSDYYTLRARAAGVNSGIKLNAEFVYETRFFETDRRAELLNEGAQSKNAFLQLALRDSTNAQTIFKSGTAAEGQDYDDMLARLDVPPVSTQLSEIPKQSFTGLSTTTSQIVGELKFFSISGSTLRDSLNSKAAILSLTYGDAADSTNTFTAKAPTDSTDPTKVYGNGYDVTFNTSPGSNRKMTNLIEKDLTTGSTQSSSWFCKSYLIVRAGSAETCNLTLAAGATQNPAYKALAAALPAGWGNGFSNNCVVTPPSNNKCYGNLPLTTPVNMTSSCNENLDCPHYLSVCYKN